MAVNGPLMVSTEAGIDNLKLEQTMNYISQINAFWKRCEEQEALGPTSIAIYFALLQIQNTSGWKPKIRIHPRELMNLTGIGSVKTLYHHLAKLRECSMIAFQPGTNQYHPTYFTINNLYGAVSLPRQKLPEHGNSTVTASKQQLPKQTSETPENTDSSEAPKPVNKETLKQGEKEEQVFEDLKKKLLLIYKGFVHQRMKMPAKISSQDLEALNSIARYLMDGSTKPEEVWQQLFQNWARLSEYYQAQICLTQIDKNLMNNLYQIQRPVKKANSTPFQKPINERSHAERKNIQF